jgi:hypothetical protein
VAALRAKGVGWLAAPWVAKDYGLKVRPLTSFAAELLVDCAGAPLVEEAVKLWVVLRAGVLPKPVRGDGDGRRRRRRRRVFFFL